MTQCIITNLWFWSRLFPFQITTQKLFCQIDKSVATQHPADPLVPFRGPRGQREPKPPEN